MVLRLLHGPHRKSGFCIVRNEETKSSSSMSKNPNDSNSLVAILGMILLSTETRRSYAKRIQFQVPRTGHFLLICTTFVLLQSIRKFHAGKKSHNAHMPMSAVFYVSQAVSLDSLNAVAATPRDCSLQRSFGSPCPVHPKGQADQIAYENDPMRPCYTSWTTFCA